MPVLIGLFFAIAIWIGFAVMGAIAYGAVVFMTTFPVFTAGFVTVCFLVTWFLSIIVAAEEY